MSRNQLHVTKLEAFKEFLDKLGIAHRPGRGEWEVLQVNIKDNIWHCVFKRARMGEHFTAASPLDPLVNEFGRMSKPFRWRTKDKEMIAPCNMHTRHLYFILRMIWNHTVPEHLKFLPYRRYHLGPYYTTMYLKWAIENIVEELAKRTDIEPNWKETLIEIGKRSVIWREENALHV